jgi:hypothetical protein
MKVKNELYRKIKEVCGKDKESGGTKEKDEYAEVCLHNIYYILIIN